MADIGDGPRQRASYAPATLGDTAQSAHELLVWCKREGCRHEVRIDPAALAELADRHGAELSLMDWKARLRCSACGSRDVDLVVASGARKGLTAE